MSEILSVNPRTLRPPTVEYREKRDPEHINRLAAAMKSKGFFGVIYARRLADGALEVVWGETRRQAAIQAGLELVNVQVHEGPLTETDITLMQLQENDIRSDYRPIERFRAMLRLKELNGWSNAELARRLPCSPAEVTRAFAVLELPADLQEHVGEGDNKVGASLAYAMVRKLDDEALIRDLFDKVRKGLLTRQSLEDKLEELTGTQKKSRGPKPLRFTVSKGLMFTLTGLTAKQLLADLGILSDAVSKVQKHGLPLTALPSLLRHDGDGDAGSPVPV